MLDSTQATQVPSQIAFGGKDIGLAALKQKLKQWCSGDVEKIMAADILFRCADEGSRVLNLEAQRLSEIPPTILQFPQFERLEEINLDSNCFKTFPSELANLPNLKVLKLGSNELDELPCEGAPFEKLKELALDANSIEKVSTLTWLPALEKLDLSYNDLANIDFLESVPTLQKLNIDNCPVNELPECVASNWHLTEISAIGTGLSSKSSLGSGELITNAGESNIFPMDDIP